jgi:hypothetical protein
VVKPQPRFYRVFSRHEDGTDVLETQRTDGGVANQDVDLLKSVLHRTAWVVEVA